MKAMVEATGILNEVKKKFDYTLESIAECTRAARNKNIPPHAPYSDKPAHARALMGSIQRLSEEFYGHYQSFERDVRLTEEERSQLWSWHDTVTNTANYARKSIIDKYPQLREVAV